MDKPRRYITYMCVQCIHKLLQQLWCFQTKPVRKSHCIAGQLYHRSLGCMHGFVIQEQFYVFQRVDPQKPLVHCTLHYDATVQGGNQCHCRVMHPLWQGTSMYSRVHRLPRKLLVFSSWSPPMSNVWLHFLHWLVVLSSLSIIIP